MARSSPPLKEALSPSAQGIQAKKISEPPFRRWHSKPKDAQAETVKNFAKRIMLDAVLLNTAEAASTYSLEPSSGSPSITKSP